jgi:serine/threonine-protein kinase
MAPARRGGSLRAEARTVAQLRHPGIVAVYAVQHDDDGDEFLVLEFVDGKSLEELLRGERPSAIEATRMVLEVVQALQHASTGPCTAT